MKQETPGRPSDLQRELLPRIVALIRGDGLAPGTRLGEVALATRLRVSRTPVRAALAHLAVRGIVERGGVERGTGRGFFVAAASRRTRTPTPVPAASDRLFLAIARDRLAGRLPIEISEADLMRRYKVTRALLQRVLGKLAEVALVERKRGHGWSFLPTISDSEARAESYRFRLLVEPAALREPGFRLDPGWVAEMRRRHEAMLAMPWRDTASVALFEMNADFHEGLAAASGNRYLLTAIQQQNRLRRFANYDWVFGHERVVVSCREHLAILDCLARGRREHAATVLRRHLEGAAGLVRPAAPVRRKTG
jgi:DNA-binding GntR family transcriptional regulator